MKIHVITDKVDELSFKQFLDTTSIIGPLVSTAEENDNERRRGHLSFLLKIERFSHKLHWKIDTELYSYVSEILIFNTIKLIHLIPIHHSL